MLDHGGQEVRSAATGPVLHGQGHFHDALLREGIDDRADRDVETASTAPMTVLLTGE
jgi:hypothetical protein